MVDISRKLNLQYEVIPTVCMELLPDSAGKNYLEILPVEGHIDIHIVIKTLNE